MPQSALFQQLAGLEKEVDALLACKRAEATAALRDCPTVPKMLRVYLFATHSNQPGAPATAPTAASAKATATAAAAGACSCAKYCCWGGLTSTQALAHA